MIPDFHFLRRQSFTQTPSDLVCHAPPGSRSANASARHPPPTGEALSAWADDHFIGHLSWKRSWSFLTMVAAVLSTKSPLPFFTTSWR